jgi:hypothetical protein
MFAPMNPLTGMLYDPREYDERRACRIAELYAGGARSDEGRLLTLRQLHESDPANVPPPGVILRWKRESVRFAMAMREAERARALEMIEDTIAIADDPTRSAAHARNAIDARFRLAEALDRSLFGTGNARNGIPSDDPFAEASGEQIESMDEAQLVAIIERERLRIGGPASATDDPLAGEGGTPPQR